MLSQINDILDKVDPNRIAELAMKRVEIPSPSGEEAEATAFFAQYLRGIGLDVEVDRTYPESPSIIAYVRGSEGGPTLQLDGHIDTVSAEHPPGELKDGRLYGRGAADMKGNLAAMAEAAGQIFKANVPFPGNLMLSIHGQHEDAVGDLPMHAPLFSLFEKGLYGDAAIVCEGPHSGMVIAAKGLSFWEIDIQREGDTIHEVVSGGAANPLRAAYRVIQALEDKAAKWAQEPDPDVGPQSFFVGQITGGDYYNRVPTHVHMKGTRRTIPGVDFETMQEEFQDLVNRISVDMELKIDLKLLRSGQSYRLSPDEPVVKAVCDAHEIVTHEPLPFIGLRYTGNASQFNNIAGIPTVYYGADQHRAHANPEWIDIENLAKATKVYLLSALKYFELANSDVEGRVDV
jgi:acetylornithine deacetylase/succinyl-diaminopimelate desuccinylase-like protein